MSPAQRKRPSSLETHFPKWRRVEDSDTDSDIPKAECPRCFKKIKMNRGSLSGVRAHELSCPGRQKETEAEFERASKQRGARALSIEALIELVVDTGIPLSIVENDSFSKFASKLCPSFVMPSRHTLGREIKKKVLKHPQTIKDELADVKDMGITTDIWSRSSRSSFVGIVAHFCTDGGLQRRLIDFVDLKGRHTGANIASCLYTSLENAGCLGKVRSITTDSASSNFKAIGLLRTQYGLWAKASVDESELDSGSPPDSDSASPQRSDQVETDGTELSDLLRDGESFLGGGEDADDEGADAEDIDDSYDQAWSDGVNRESDRSMRNVGNLLKKLRNHSRFIRQSNVAFDVLHSCIVESGASSFRIIPRDVVVRWNSTYGLVSWFCTYREAFSSFQRQCLARRNSDRLKKYMKVNALSLRDEEVLDMLQGQLSWFEQGTRKFSAGLYTTISSVRPVVRGMLRKLDSGPIGHGRASRMRQALSSATKKYFEHALHTNGDDIVGHIYAAAAFLDPSYTTTETTLDGTRSVQKVMEYFGIQDTLNPDQSSQQPTQDSNEDSDDLLTAIRRRSEPSTSANPSTISRELDIYAIRLSAHKRWKGDFVKYWHLSEANETPILRSLALLMAVMQASSVSAEEAFSVAGSLSRVRRSRLAGDSLRALMLLRNR